jgi:hypothetical protein
LERLAVRLGGDGKLAEADDAMNVSLKLPFPFSRPLSVLLSGIVSHPSLLVLRCLSGHNLAEPTPLPHGCVTSNLKNYLEAQRQLSLLAISTSALSTEVDTVSAALKGECPISTIAFARSGLDLSPCLVAIFVRVICSRASKVRG